MVCQVVGQSVADAERRAVGPHDVDAHDFGVLGAGVSEVGAGKGPTRGLKDAGVALEEPFRHCTNLAGARFAPPSRPCTNSFIESVIGRSGASLGRSCMSLRVVADPICVSPVPVIRKLASLSGWWTGGKQAVLSGDQVIAFLFRPKARLDNRAKPDALGDGILGKRIRRRRICQHTNDIAVHQTDAGLPGAVAELNCTDIVTHGSVLSNPAGIYDKVLFRTHAAVVSPKPQSHAGNIGGVQAAR